MKIPEQILDAPHRRRATRAIKTRAKRKILIVPVNGKIKRRTASKANTPVIIRYRHMDLIP
jgi:hypothetical protein